MLKMQKPASFLLSPTYVLGVGRPQLNCCYCARPYIRTRFNCCRWRPCSYGLHPVRYAAGQDYLKNLLRGDYQFDWWNSLYYLWRVRTNLENPVD